jgi:hypothetical protein
MEGDLLSRATRIGDPAAAAALVDPARRRILFAFARGARSIAEVAAEQQHDLKRLHYHVGQLEKLGLLAVADAVKRAGRPIKLYRTTAEAWFVPARLAPRAAHDLAERLDRGLELGHLKRKGGALFYASETGAPRVRALEPEGAAAPSVDLWRTLKLAPQDAAALMAEVEDLLYRWAARRDEAGQPLVVRLAVAPDPEPQAGSSSDT